MVLGKNFEPYIMEIIIFYFILHYAEINCSTSCTPQKVLIVEIIPDATFSQGGAA